MTAITTPTGGMRPPRFFHLRGSVRRLNSFAANRRLLIIGMVAVLLVQSSQTRAAETAPAGATTRTNATSANYPRAAKPVVPFAFTPLPLGAVEPEGWLRDWAVAARHGITGHLDERNPVFHDGWKGIPIKWTNAKEDGTGWPLEQSAYWMDGAIRLGFILHDDGLIKKIRGAARPDRRWREQGGLWYQFCLLENELETDGLQQLGAFANGPCAGRTVLRQR